MRYGLFAMALMLAGCSSGDPDPREPSRAEMFTSVATVRPGEVFTLAVRFSMAPGWHTYAQDPGDSGMPPSVTVKGPAGLEVGPWRFPPAQTFTDAAGTTYGYEKAVVLLSEVRVPETHPLDIPLTLELDVVWMVCLDSCIPMEAGITLALPVRSLTPEPAPGWQSLLNAGGWSARENTQTGSATSRKE